MSKEKDLIKNTSILMIGGVFSKFFTFLLLPLYTNAISPDDFGTIDILQTVIALAMYIIPLQIEEGVFRFLIESRGSKQGQQRIITSGICLLVINTLVFLILSGLFLLLWPIPHFGLFALSFFSSALSSFMFNIPRGLGHNVLFSIASFLSTICSLFVNLVLILGFHLGGTSILVALIVSNLFASFYIALQEKIWIYLRKEAFQFALIREMLEYTLPLIPNALSWWVANASDRIIISLFLGNWANGLYAAANKIPTIYTNIYVYFNLAWTESIALNIHDADREQFLSKMFDRMIRLFSFLALGILTCASLFFPLLIGAEYSNSYFHVFILVVAVFVNSLCSVYGGLFAGFKKSKTVGLTTTIGAVTNLLVNLSLVKILGLYAASVSTLVSYIVILAARKHAADKLVKTRFPLGFLLQLLLVFAVVTTGYVIRNTWLNVGILLLLILWGTWNNREIFLEILQMLVQKLGISKTK